MLALVLGAVLLALCPGCLAQSWAQGPLAIYNDGDPAAAGNMDLARKKAFVNSLTVSALCSSKLQATQCHASDGGYVGVPRGTQECSTSR